MGEVVRFPGSKRPHYIERSANRVDLIQASCVKLAKIRDDLRARIEAEIAAHDAYAEYTKQIIQYQKDHPDGDDVA